MAALIDLIYPACSGTSPSDEAELQTRAEPSGKPWEETVVGELVLEQQRAREVSAEAGAFWRELAGMFRKDRE